MGTKQPTHTILIVAHQPDIISALRTGLQDEDHDVLCVDPASDVMSAINAHRPDLALIVIDADTRDIGLALCQDIQRLSDRRRVPVILITDADDDDQINRIFAAGAVDYIMLPVRPVVLRQRVRHNLAVRAMQGTLSEKEERYRIISTTITDYAYAYGVNPDGSLRKEWNTHAFESITGYSPHELDGDGWSQLIHPDDRELTIKRYHRLLSGEKDVTEFRIITKQGEVRWLMDHGYPVIDEVTGRVIRIYGAAQDITERKRTEEMLRTQASELKARNEELDAFAHTVAHDLKNPISSMMGFASLVLNYYDRMTDDKIVEYISLIMESGYKLKEIINSLLLLAGVNRMDAVELTDLDMHDVVRQAQVRMLTMMDETGAEFLEPERFPTAVGYAPWVEEVWANYISNALKYGGTPPIVEVGADVPVNGTVRFWVKDNGNGLTDEEMTKVFTPFERLSQAKIEGHGLGLSVVNRIVERLGGEVGVERMPEGGSLFSFTLPTTPHHTTPHAEQSQSERS